MGSEGRHLRLQRRAANRRRNVHARHEADCPAYPYYGQALHRHFIDLSARGLAWSSCSVPRDQWPDNFVEDPESPGLGAYYCPTCRRGMGERWS
jgi:hypothetical protein